MVVNSAGNWGEQKEDWSAGEKAGHSVGKKDDQWDYQTAAESDVMMAAWTVVWWVVRSVDKKVDQKEDWSAGEMVVQSADM